MKPWAQEIIADQAVRLEAFASEAVGSPVEIDTRRLVGRGLYGYVFDLYFRDGRHTGYVLKLTSDWSELLAWSWLQQWNLPGVVSILAVGKGRTEVESPSGMALPTVIVREKVGGWDDYPDSGIARDVSKALDSWREADGRVLPGDPAPAADLARRLMRIEHAHAAGAAILRLLKAKLVPHDLNQQNFGWREDGTLVLLDPSVDPMVTRRPKRVPAVLKNPRDPIREQSYPLPIRAALDAWTQSRAKAGAHGRVRWQETTYPWIEEQLAAGRLDDLLAEIVGLVDENRAKAIQRRADRRLGAAERLWERQAVEVDSWQPRKQLRRDLAGRDVWLWHGTSSTLLPEIRRRGLLAEPPKKTHQSSTSGYIYLTTEAGDYGSGGSAVFYARSAAGKHGGDPVLLRVIVPWNELEPDADDEELSCGRRQFRTARDIAVEQIKEIGDERVGWPETWPKYRNPVGEDWLILVHPGSLDSYADFTQSEALAVRLGHAMISAVADHDGPVLVADNPDLGDALYREFRAALLRTKPDVMVMQFDEDLHGWPQFLERLTKRIRAHGAPRSIKVGGIWWRDDLKDGCASTVYGHLSDVFGKEVMVEPEREILGTEED